MIQTQILADGITLRCFYDNRFKQGALSLQLIRPMRPEEAAMNALLPAVLLRGTTRYPDLRAITLHLDDLYGASVGTMVRRVGDYQTTGLCCGMMDDRFALPGDKVLGPMVDFLEELLFDPCMENGGFKTDFVESEKKNLIATIESELNDKRAYAMGRMLKKMCAADSFGVPRLGEKEWVTAIDSRALYAHYQKILRESRIDIFYVGSAPAWQVASMLQPLVRRIDRSYIPLPAQTPFRDAGPSDTTEEMDVAQGKFCQGYVTPITIGHPAFAAMQVMNTIFGAGMTSKLFMNVREKLSLCYSIGTGYYSAKGIVTLSAGIDTANEEQTRQEIAAQLEAIRQGDITDEELAAAKEAILSGLRGTHDSPGVIEGYYSTAALSGLNMAPAEYMDKIAAVTRQQVAEAAQALRLHTTYFLKGADHGTI
ncbi:MAG: insulinase family protein [Oscillospiraceae bacterium]|nr:insulinase family protein [Oscillospiraceae bacterium]